MKTIYKSFSIVTLSAIITRGISFIFKIYLSRFLGAEILGLYQITFSIFLLIACFSTSGIPLALSRSIAECYSKNETKKVFSLISTGLILSFFFSAIPCTIVLIFPNIFNFFFQDKRCTTLLVIMLPLLFTTSIYAIFRSYFWGKKDFNIFALTELLDEVFKIIFSIIIFSFFIGKFIDSIYAYAVAMILGDILLIIVLIILFKRKGGKLLLPTEFKELTKSSTPITFQRLIAALLSSYISIVLPFVLVNKCNLSVSEATSEYGRASGMVMSLIMAPNAILGSLNVILIPEMAEMNCSNNSKLLIDKFNKFFVVTLAICATFLFLFIGMGNELGTLLYNDPLVGKYLAFASIIVIPLGINGIMVSTLNSIKKESNAFYSYVASSILLIAIIYFAPKYIGIYAYFIGLFVFHFSNMIINGFMINKCISIYTKSYFSGTMLTIIGIILGLIVKVIASALSMSLLIKTIILGVICSSIIVITFFSLYFKKHRIYKLKIRNQH